MQFRPLFRSRRLLTYPTRRSFAARTAFSIPDKHNGPGSTLANVWSKIFRGCLFKPYLRPTQTSNTMPLNLAITNEEKIQVTLAPTTAAGNPASVDGAPVWTVTEGDATLEVAEGGMSAYLVSGAVGTSTITVTADADLDEGETRELSDTIALNVVNAEAAGLGLTAGSAEPK